MRIYYRVPFKDKNEAKSLGLYWDVARKCWYVPENYTGELPNKKWTKIPEPKPVGKIWNDTLKRYV